MLPLDDEALQSDVYLELLLDAHRRGPTLAAGMTDEGAGPEVRSAAQLLDRTLVRFHPSFRFEEALAGRLRAAADAVSHPGGTRGLTVAFPVRPGVAARIPLPTSRIPLPPGRISLPTDDREALNRVLVGGAIASGLSLASAAAWLAWRRRSRETVA